jgi:ubiquinone/menaquinone biosynthesis C-methylase UbiE
MPLSTSGSACSGRGIVANRVLRAVLRPFFHHFYHEFAWTYDLVAATVSLGRWNDWIESVVPFVIGPRVLEIGHGPGHLQAKLSTTGGIVPVGLDESPEMGSLARRRLSAQAGEAANLVRCLAQSMPLAAFAFDTVVATFPAEFIFEPATLLEVRRVLCDGGRFVILPAAWITGRQLADRSAAWLFRITHQAPQAAIQSVIEDLTRRLRQADFQASVHTVELRGSLVLILVGFK